MPKVIEDIVQGNSLTDGNGNAQIVRVFMVHELKGIPNARGIEAILQPDIPAKFSSHPAAGGLIVVSRSVEMVDLEIAKVTVNYSTPAKNQTEPKDDGEPKLRIGAGLVSVTTEKELDPLTGTFVNGERIEVSYVKNFGKDPDTGLDVIKTVRQGGQLNVQIAQMSLSFQRIEKENPFTKLFLVTNSVNQKNFMTLPAKHWLCTGGDAQQRDDKSYDVTYNFQSNSEQWTPQFILYFDQEKNEHPADAKPKAVNVYPEKDWTNLNLQEWFI